MSERSRERWRRYALIGQLRMANRILYRVAKAADFLSMEERNRAAHLAHLVGLYLTSIPKEKLDNPALSAKKGS
jgi:hypothetical protein